MKSAQLLQLAFIAVAATAVYGFVSMAREAETRRACVLAPCALPRRPQSHVPDSALPDADGKGVHLAVSRKNGGLNFWTTTASLVSRLLWQSLARRSNRDDVVVLPFHRLNKDVALTALQHTCALPPFSCFRSRVQRGSRPVRDRLFRRLDHRPQGHRASLRRRGTGRMRW
jgi:hypothetical protein